MRYAAFLRAINVGGRNVPMARLRAIFESIGFEGVATVIASGNVVFEAREPKPAQVESAIEDAVAKALGWRADTFVRSQAELEAVVAGAPFDSAEIEAAAAFHVAFLRAHPSSVAVARLMECESTVDRLAINGREAYWLRRVRQSESKFTNAALEKALGMPATMRGMATVEKVLARLR